MKFDEWEKLSQKEFKGGYKTYLTKTFKLPSGHIHNFDIDVVTNGGFVSMLALTPQMDVIVVKQFRPGPERVVYDLPSGIIEPNEDLETAARRELLEETGFAPSRMELVAKDVVFNPYTQGFANFFVALDCNKEAELNLDDAESIEVEIMPLKQYFNDQVRKGNVSHADCAWLGVDYLIRSKQIQYSDIL